MAGRSVRATRTRTDHGHEALNYIETPGYRITRRTLMEEPPIPGDREAVVAHTVVSTILHGVPLIILLAAMLIRVPKFQETFKSFGTDLPAITVALLNFTTWCRFNVFLLLGIVGLLLAGYAAVYHHARKYADPAWHVLWSGLWYLLILLLFAGMTIAVVQPLRELMTTVGNQAGG